MGQRMTMEQYRKISKSKKSKYGNKKVEIDEITFDSIAESRMYLELKSKQKNGEILFFRVQPRYRLIDSQKKHGKTHRSADYIADFEVHHTDGSIEVIDVKSKGTITPVFKLKEKVFHSVYPHKLTLKQWKNGRFEEI